MKKKSGLPALAVGVILLCAWAVASSALQSAFLPSPQATFERLWLGLSSYYLQASWVTLYQALAGCLLAAVLGIPSGYLLARSRLFKRAIQPYLAASQAIPGVAIAPLLTIWIGYGVPSIVVLCTIMVIFPVIISSALGFSHINADVLGAARLDGASGWKLFRYIELPLAAPGILADLRTGFTLSITGSVVGEMIIGGDGLGLLLTSAQASADVTGMFATIVLLALLATSLYALISALEYRANYLLREETYSVQRSQGSMVSKGSSTHS